MADLISSITSLCKLLDCLIGLSDSLKPDFFRLSKLNKLGSEQAQQLWNVIHKLCCFSTTTSSCQGDPFKCIESYLRKKGGVVAYFLSADATARQLLLCLGFLLSERIIETNIDKVLMGTPLGEELPSFMVEPDNPADLIHIEPNIGNQQVLLNQFLFLYGKVQHNHRAIANYRQEAVQLFSKIHMNTAGAQGLPHLSVGDVLMMMQPTLQEEFVRRCQPCVLVLQAYSKWQRKKLVFWKWMDSVLEEELKSNNKPPSVADITHLHEFLRRLKSDVQGRKLTECENSNDGGRSQITSRRMHLSKNGEILDSLVRKIDLEINSYLTDTNNKIQEIQSKLPKDGDQHNAVNKILLMCCDSKKESKHRPKLRLSESELTIVTKLEGLSTD